MATPVEKYLNKKYGIEKGVLLNSKTAELWLDSIVRQRNVKERVVEQYKELILNNKWEYPNGQTVIFDTNGEFRDGQHRAWAVIESKKSIKVDVVFGVHPDAIRTIDTGSSRTYGDTLIMEEKEFGNKLKNANVIGTALKLIRAYEAGDIYARIDCTNDEIYESFKVHSQIVESAELVCHRDILISASICTALHYLFTRVSSHKNLADEFFQSFRSGENLSKGSPILSLRRKFINAKANKASINKWFAISCIIKAWEAYRKGETLSAISFNPSNLPKIKKRIIKEVA